MTTLATFFKGSGTQFGIFYPRDYMIAIFKNYAPAEISVRRLRDAGFKPDNAIAVPGEEVVRFAEENLKKKGLWALLMQELSRIFETEEVYADRDLHLASEGAGFVAIHCPTDAVKDNAWTLLEPMHPLVARYYRLGGVEHLKGEV